MIQKQQIIIRISINITLLLLFLGFGYYAGVKDSETLPCITSGGVPVTLVNNEDTFYFCWDTQINSNLLYDDLFLNNLKFEIIGGYKIDNTNTND